VHENHDGLLFWFEGADDLTAAITRVGRASWGSERASSKASDIGACARPIRCRLHRAPPAANQQERRPPGWLDWSWTASEARVSTQAGQARIWRQGSDFAAEAWLPPDDRGVQTLLAGLSSAILHAQGGVILHSSSVQLDGGVIAFLGPSGAGKSTASRQVEGSALFSVDRLAVAPRRGGGGWLAYPLLGGTLIDANMPRAVPAWQPLLALFRVHQSSHGCTLQCCSRVGKLALLRESTYLGSREAATELELLSRLERLEADLPVARLHFGLGTCLTPLLRRSVETMSNQER
jgi:hypothetical protein